MTNKTIKKLFRFASQEQADKLIISSSEQDFSCRCQLPYGEEAIFKLPKKLEVDLATNLRRLLKIAPEELADGKYCKLKDKSCQLNFRISIIPHGNSEKIIINIIKNGQKIIGLNKLGLQTAHKKQLENAINRKGLIIISSEARQGRTTTLFSCLQKIDRDKRAVYFLGEQPEFDLAGVSHLADSLADWEKVLKHDSEVIALDSDNSENWRQAIKAAATGRLVIMTITATNALEALYKVLDLGLPKKLVLDNLKIISGQALINLKRKGLKQASAKTEKQRQQIGVFEILAPNRKLIDLLADANNSHKSTAVWQETLRLAKKNGYQPMSLDLAKKKKEGLV